MSFVCATALALVLSAQGAPAIPTPEDIEREVLENVKRQPLGEGTVEDLALPEEFLRRVADRIVCSSFEERYRIVVPDAAPPKSGAAKPSARTALVAAGLLAIGGFLWILITRRRERVAA